MIVDNTTVGLAAGVALLLIAELLRKFTSQCMAPRR